MKFFRFLAATVLCTLFFPSIGHSQVLLTEGFESPTFPPIGWVRVNVGFGQEWTRSTSITYNSSAGAAFVSASTDEENTWLISPGVNLVAGTQYTIRFFYRAGSFGNDDASFVVRVGTSQTVNSQQSGQNLGARATSSTSWVQFSATFTPTIGGPYSFSIQCNSSDFQSRSLSVDDITIEGAQSCTLAGGTYTINSTQATGGTNFNSFSAAVQALVTCGIGGPVIFNVSQNTYTEQISIPAITGASATNTITFRSNPANTLPANLQFSSTSAGDNYVVQFLGTRHIRFENINLLNQGFNQTRVFVFDNGNENIQIRGCTITGRLGIFGGNNFSPVYASGNAADRQILITQSTVVGGAFGIQFAGTSSSVLDEDVVITDNNIQNVGAYGIILGYTGNGLVVARNTINLSSGATSGRGISINNHSGQGDIHANQVLITPTMSSVALSYGVFIQNSTNPSNRFLRIYNNFISMPVGGVSASSGIYTEASSNVQIAFNNVLITGNNPSSHAIRVNAGTGGAGLIDVVNNNFVHQGSGYAVSVSDLNMGNAPIINMNYNNFLTNGAQFGQYNNNNIANIASWRSTTTYDQNSLNVDPDYIGTSDLHIQNFILNGAGFPVANITVDIDGDTRANPPAIGADEISNLPCILQVIRGAAIEPTCAGATDGSACIILLNSIPPVNVVWSHNGSSGLCQQNLASGTYSVTVTDAVCDTVLTFNIDGPDPLVSSIAINPIRCFGENNGRLTASVTGGTAPYNYIWTGNPAVTPTIQNLAPGSYVLNVIDANGCSEVDTVVLVEPAPLTVQPTPTDLVCTDDSNASILLVNSGGTPPYVFNWSNNQTGNPINNLAAGSYQYTVVDSRGCRVESQVVIDNPTSIAPDVIIQNANVLSVVGNYQNFQWYFNGNPISGANSSELDIVPVGSGFYQVQVSDGICTALTDSFNFNVIGVQTLADFGIRLYPIPATQFLKLEWNQAKVNENIRWRMFNAEGRALNPAVQQQNQFFMWEISDLPSGLYLLQVQTGELNESLRWIKW